jgi:anti-sigma factor RsiW
MTEPTPLISCTDAMRRLWEYLDRALPDLETAEVGRHLAECARCRPHAAFERRLLDEIVAIRPEPGELSSVKRRLGEVFANERGTT